MDHPVLGAVAAGAAKVVDDAVGLLPTGPCRGADLGPPLQRGETGGQGPDRGRIKLEAKIPPPSLILVPVFSNIHLVVLSDTIPASHFFPRFCSERVPKLL
jgi:hypothetical protein